MPATAEQTAIAEPQVALDGPQHCWWCGLPAVSKVLVEDAVYTSKRRRHGDGRETVIQVLVRPARYAPACRRHARPTPAERVGERRRRERMARKDMDERQERLC